jgi:hypothetical protein
MRVGRRLQPAVKLEQRHVDPRRGWAMAHPVSLPCPQGFKGVAPLAQLSYPRGFKGVAPLLYDLYACTRTMVPARVDRSWTRSQSWFAVQRASALSTTGARRPANGSST